MKRLFKYLVIYIISFLLLWLIGFSTIYGDPLANFMFSKAIMMGEIPYLDFNIITTPLYSFIMSIFSYNYFTFLLGQSLLVTFLYLIINKILGRNSIFIFFLTVIFYSYNIICTYSFLVLFFLIILVYLEDKYKDLDYLIGFIIGLSILSKHVIGVFFIIPSIIFYYKDIKKLIRRFIGLIVPGFIFLFYLIYNKCLYQFFDLCLFGLFDFSKNNGTMMGNEKIFIIIASVICLIGSIIFIMFHKKDIRLYYLFFGIMFVVPLFDMSHFAFYITCIVIMILMYINLKKFYKYIVFICLIFCIIYNSITLYLWGNYKLIISDNLKYFDHIILLKSTYNQYLDYDKYIDNYDNPIILGYYTKMYSIINDRKITYFDVPMYGNSGYDGVNKMIKRIKKSKSHYIIISMSDYNSTYEYSQFYKEVCDYVINNYKLIDSKYNFNVYYKE